MRTWLARLALLGGATTLTLGGIEVGARVVAPRQLDALDMTAFTRPATVPDQVTELTPGATNPHFAGGGVRINQAGLRGPELPERSDHERILAVGDSVTFGYGVPEDAVWHAVVAAQRTRSGVPTESVNAGLTGAGLRYAAGFLERRCAALDPDQVLLGLTLNDIGPYPPMAATRRRRPRRSAHRWLLRHSHVYTGLTPMLKGMAYASGLLDLEHNAGFGFAALGRPSAALEAAWTDSLAQLDRARAAAQACGAPLVIVVFPVETQVNAEAERLYRERFGLDLYADGVAGAPQARLAAWAAARDQPLIDLLPTFRQGEAAGMYLRNAWVKLDPIHPSVEGHRRAAAAIEAALAAGPATP